MSNWRLFHGPDRFRELIRDGTVLYDREGGMLTWGEERRTEYPSVEAAELALEASADDALAHGMTHTRTWRFDRHQLRIDDLVDELVLAAERTLGEAALGGALRGFALLTDESAMTVGAMLLDQAQLDAADDPDETWFMPVDWEGGDDPASGAFDIAYRLVLDRSRDEDGRYEELPFAQARNQIVEAHLQALERLIAAGRFEPRDAVFVDLCIPQTDPVPSRVQRLCTPSQYTRWEAWVRRWGPELLD